MTLDLHPSMTPERSPDRFDTKSMELVKRGNIDFEKKVGGESFKPIKNLKGTLGVINCTHLDVRVNGEYLGSVIRLPREMTIELALEIMDEFGKENAVKVMRADRNICLYLNILYHCESFDNVYK